MSAPASDPRVYVTDHGVPAWDCPDCGRGLHARTLDWHWSRCPQCQSRETLRLAEMRPQR